MQIIEIRHFKNPLMDMLLGDVLNGKPFFDTKIFDGKTDDETRNHEILPDEPFSEIIEGENEISIIFELPGVEEKDINLKVDPTGFKGKMEIDAKTGEKWYHKFVNLPCRVKPDTALDVTEWVKSTYKNEILDVRIKRKC